jgi:hypothetical protein
MIKFPSLFLRLIAATTATAAAFLITACGGGGGSDSPAAAPDQPIQTSLLAQYQGTWLDSCQPLGGNTQASSRSTLIIGAPSANESASVGSSEFYYNSADCTGAVVATVTELPSSVSATGTKTIGTVNVVKVDITTPAGTPTFSGSVSLVPCATGGPIEVRVAIGNGGVASCQSIDLVARTFKTVFTNVTSNTFGFGDDESPLDPQGYPTVLSTAYGSLKKQ